MICLSSAEAEFNGVNGGVAAWFEELFFKADPAFPALPSGNASVDGFVSGNWSGTHLAFGSEAPVGSDRLQGAAVQSAQGPHQRECGRQP